jgi:haloalkane dehalogenase
MQRASPNLSDAEAAAYGAPFPDARYKAGVRRFPDLVPDHPDAPGAALSRAAARFWSTLWSGASFMAVGALDPVLTPAMMEKLRATIAGCPEPMMIDEGGHFVQEWGEPIARTAMAAFAQR